eukprot:c24420_g1_i1 orf=93-1112(+)
MSLQQLRPLGSQGLKVSCLGLGCMGLSAFYGTPVEEDVGMDLIRHAINSGASFLDTSDVYGPFTNELLVGKAIKSFPRESIQLATKFGVVYENGVMVVKGTVDHVRQACEDSLKRLDVDYIDLYYQHRVDTSVPIEETVGEMKRLVEEGKVKYIGLSEASANTIRRAHAVHPITAVQLEWSLWSRDVEENIIPTCRELGIGIVAYSPLGRGFFTGKAIFEALDSTDSRMIRMPRFQGENLEKNKVLYERISSLAKKHGCTPGQLALAWVLHQGDDVVPIPGTTKKKNFDENMAALKVELSKEDLDEISAAVPASEVVGDRYGAGMEKRLFQYADTPLKE